MKIGEVVIKEKFCAERDVKKALETQQKGDQRPLGEILLSRENITKDQLEKALRIQK
ncbi:MAG: hypothetical protein ISS00_02300 [Candidatus Marinimicrobia bacterium]|nr:hypothetical protein [Candidatus Neomarinimicrobiota bacterium]